MKLYKKNKNGKLILINVPDYYTNISISSVYNNTSSVINKGSIDFSSLNSYFSVPASSDWAVGAGDFTIEWFQYQTSAAVGRFPRVFSVKEHPSTSVGVSIESGTFYLWLGANGIGYIGASLTNYLNRWVHFAICRNGTTLNLYKDGISISTSTNSTAANNSTDPLIIGDDVVNEALSRFPGLITNFRFIKGTSVYSGNFSISTSPLTAISNTKLLLLADTSQGVSVDSSTLQKTVTCLNPSWNSSSPF